MPEPSEIQSSQNDQLLQQLHEKAEILLQQRRDLVNQAKADTPQKEPFDINALQATYSLRGNDGQPVIDKSLVQALEAEYYIDNPDVLSIEEFATKKSTQEQDFS